MCLQHFKQTIHNNIFKQLSQFSPIQKILVIQYPNSNKYLFNQLIDILNQQYQIYTLSKQNYIELYQLDNSNPENYKKQLHEIYNYAQQKQYNQIIDTKCGEQLSEQFLYFLSNKQLPAAKYTVSQVVQWEQTWKYLNKIDENDLKLQNYKVKSINNKILFMRPFILLGDNLIQTIKQEQNIQNNKDIASHYYAINKGDKIKIQPDLEQYECKICKCLQCGL